jgi:hypothetical protein
MRNFFSSKLFIGLAFFCLGFLVSNQLVSINRSPSITYDKAERFPVDPDDFDHEKMLESLRRTQGDQSLFGASRLSEIEQKEDEDYVYYNIPLQSQDGTTHKLDVEVKNNMIRITEDLRDQRGADIETSSERVFSIDPRLNPDEALVLNEKDRIVIKIPKRK